MKTTTYFQIPICQCRRCRWEQRRLRLRDALRIYDSPQEALTCWAGGLVFVALVLAGILGY